MSGPVINKVSKKAVSSVKRRSRDLMTIQELHNVVDVDLAQT
jgi:hypothetical protein